MFAHWPIVFGLLLAPSGSPGVDPGAGPHVRSESMQVRRWIEETAARSAVVRELIARLACTDVIVYVEMTASPEIPRARTKLVTALPGVRFLRIGINLSMAGANFAPLLGHELQHAVEIAELDDVRDEEAVRRLYRKIGRAASGDRFETEAALDVEWRVRLECRTESDVTTDTWTAVDDYIIGLVQPTDPVLDAAQDAARAADLPPISVSAAQGKFLHLLARIQGARRILEIGTLAGYSTIWLARALPADGRLITLEFDPKHADVARANLARAGLAAKVDLRVGRAIDALPALTSEGPFDLVFIDADKPSTTDYFHWALKLSRRGTVIVVDNVVRDGKVIKPAGDESAEGMNAFMKALSAEKRVSATVLQTVGAKGYDGFALAVVETPA